MDLREALLNAAVKVFSEAGTRGATTRRIADVAGVNEVTLFRHFGTKDALIHEALDWAISRVSAAPLPAAPRDPATELTQWSRAHHANMHRLRAMIRTAMGEFEEHPEVSSLMFKGPKRVGDELHAYLLRLRDLGLAEGDWDARAAAAMLMGALFADAMGRDIMPHRYPYALRDAAPRYVALLLRAIGAKQVRVVRSRSGKQSARKIA
jgi:AcrR family transcriptional regulator